MNSVVLGIAMVMAAPAGTMGLGPDVQTPAATPATAIDRPENNPAKAAARVTEALESSGETSGKDITVTTHAGTVVLNGEVRTSSEAERAKSVAEKAAGGDARVSSALSVREDHTDAMRAEADRLVLAVHTALLGNTRTAHLGVSVASSGPESVSLHGLVPSRETRELAGSVAASVKGVKKVDNRLLLPDDPQPAR